MHCVALWFAFGRVERDGHLSAPSGLIESRACSTGVGAAAAALQRAACCRHGAAAAARTYLSQYTAHLCSTRGLTAT